MVRWEPSGPGQNSFPPADTPSRTCPSPRPAVQPPPWLSETTRLAVGWAAGALLLGEECPGVGVPAAQLACPTSCGTVPTVGSFRLLWPLSSPSWPSADFWGSHASAGGIRSVFSVVVHEVETGRLPGLGESPPPYVPSPSPGALVPSTLNVGWFSCFLLFLRPAFAAPCLHRSAFVAPWHRAHNGPLLAMELHTVPPGSVRAVRGTGGVTAATEPVPLGDPDLPLSPSPAH